MSNNSIDFLKEALSAPLGDLITAIGEGVGEAQAALDRGALEQMLALYQQSDDKDEVLELLRKVGYQPTFYSIPETKVKAKVSLAMTQSNQSGPSPVYPDRLSKTKVYGTPINASVTNKFNIDLNASAEIEFTIRPVPPLVDARVVPNIIGLELSAAIELLESLGLSYKIAEGENPEDTDIVQDQLPAKDQPVLRGYEVALIFTVS